LAEWYRDRMRIGGQSLLVAMIVLCVSDASGGINGSAHDFAFVSRSDYPICAVCHVPYGGQTFVPSPLWNHEITTETFTPYDRSTMLEWKPGEIGAVSKLCLSCHDGVISIDAYGGRTGSEWLTGYANVNLTNSHSTSFPWRRQALDGSCMNKCLEPSPPPTLPLFDYMIECPTCHDVHNANNVSNLLRMSNADSALCQTCHRGYVSWRTNILLELPARRPRWNLPTLRVTTDPFEKRK